MKKQFLLGIWSLSVLLGTVPFLKADEALKLIPEGKSRSLSQPTNGDGCARIFWQLR